MQVDVFFTMRHDGRDSLEDSPEVNKGGMGWWGRIAQISIMGRNIELRGSC
jgi:hypothetical protein